MIPCFSCRVEISHVCCFCCVIVMENTVLVQVCNTVAPSLVFHTGGMFVILINVSIFRMSIEKKKEFIHAEADTSKGAVCLVFG